MFDFSGRVAIITSAVSNLGVATARAFQRAGARTVLVDRSRDRLGHTYADLAGSREHLLAGGVDLTDAASVSRTVDAARERFGRLEVLVNTVGGFRGGKPVHEDDPVGFRRANRTAGVWEPGESPGLEPYQHRCPHIWMRRDQRVRALRASVTSTCEREPNSAARGGPDTPTRVLERNDSLCSCRQSRISDRARLPLG
jgi:hypothetical protein